MAYPTHIKATGAKPRLVEGHTFKCFRVSINQYAWHCEDLDLVVFRNYHRNTYSVATQKMFIGNRYYGEQGAMKAGVKTLKKWKAAEKRGLDERGRP